MTALNDTKLIKLFEHMGEQERCAFSIVSDEGFSVAYEFGREAENSPMYGGASYGLGDSLNEAMKQVYEDLRL